MVPFRDGGKTELTYSNLQNCGNIMPTLDLWIQLALYCIENTTGTEPDDIGRPIRSCTRHKKWYTSLRRYQTKLVSITSVHT